MLKRFNIFISAILVICSITSCHSHKDAVSGNYKKHYCGIELSEGDNRKLYEEVESWLGTPYRYGGNTRKGVDCSGFVVNVYQNVYGIKLQRSSELIFKKNCKKIKKSQLREGDLVFFKSGKAKRINHSGIYLKNGKFAHTSSSRGVMISSLEEEYYKRNFIHAGRVKGR